MKPKREFAVGDRVRLTEVGRLSFSKSPNRLGTIIRAGATQSRYRVQWDGQATAEYIHWTYLELDDNARAL